MRNAGAACFSSTTIEGPISWIEILAHLRRWTANARGAIKDGTPSHEFKDEFAPDGGSGFRRRVSDGNSPKQSL